MGADCALSKRKVLLLFSASSETKWNDGWKIGVAISSHPLRVPNAGSSGIGGWDDRSLCLHDTDGQPIYYGGAAKCEGGKLKTTWLK